MTMEMINIISKIVLIILIILEVIVVIINYRLKKKIKILKEEHDKLIDMALEVIKNQNQNKKD